MKRVQILGGSTSAANAFTGYSREVYVDTGANELRVHDGATAGGNRVTNLAFNDARYGAISTFLTNIAAIATATGLVAKTASGGTAAAVTITGTAAQITVANGDGAAGAPTLSIPDPFTPPGAITWTPANKTATFSPTGTGSFVVNPATLGSLDNLTLGVTTPAAATFTGKTVTGGSFQHATGTINALGSISGSSAINLNSGNIVTATQNSNTITYTFSNWAASGTYDSVEIITKLDATPHSVTFTGVTWDTSLGAPTLVASKELRVLIETIDGGTTLRASLIGQF